MTFAAITSICSQENYLPGSLVTIDNDTLKGFIDYRNWKNNPYRIAFKRQIDGESKPYTPFDIKEFRVKDEIYTAGRIEVETSPTKTEELDKDSRLKILLVYAFLQTVVYGQKSLYYYKRFKGKDNFYIKTESGYELLIHKKYLAKKDVGTVIINNNKYLGQLTLYLSECPEIRSKLKHTQYNRKSLEQLFMYYYECAGTSYQFRKEWEKALFRKGLSLGISRSSINFENYHFTPLVGADFEISTELSFALGLDVIFPRSRRRSSLYNELMYSSYNTRGYYPKVTGVNNNSNAHFELAYTYLKLNNMLRYRYEVGPVYVFINGGISNGYAIREVNDKILDANTGGSSIHVENKDIATRRYEQGILFGGGLEIKGLSLEARWEYSNGMSDMLSLSSKVRRYYFMIGYAF